MDSYPRECVIYTTWVARTQLMYTFLLRITKLLVTSAARPDMASRKRSGSSPPTEAQSAKKQRADRANRREAARDIREQARHDEM